MAGDYQRRDEDKKPLGDSSSSGAKGDPGRPEEKSRYKESAINYALWITQGLLALIFHGGIMLVSPESFPFNRFFTRFIGMCNVLCVVGLILPGLTGIRPELTPLAAAGLVLINIGLALALVEDDEAIMASFCLIAAILATFVAYGRWRLAPLRGKTASRNADSAHHHGSTGS